MNRMKLLLPALVGVQLWACQPAQELVKPELNSPSTARLNFIEASAQSPIQFSGQLNQSDIVVGLHSDGVQLTAYVCGGDESWQEATSWFKTDLPEFLAEQNEYKLTLTDPKGRKLYVDIPAYYITAPPRGLADKETLTAPPRGITAPPRGYQPQNNRPAKVTLESENTVYTGEMDFCPAESAAGLYRHADENEVVGVVVTQNGYAQGVGIDAQSKTPLYQTRLQAELQDKACIQVQAGKQELTLAAQDTPEACQLDTDS